MKMGRHLEIVRHEGELLASLPADALDAPVPTVEGWTLQHVVRHTGKVHQWVTGALRLGPGQGMADIGELPGMPKGPECLPAYREALDAMLAAFAEHEPSDAVPTFAGQGDAAWWARRQAHEVAVHRTDGSDAVAAAGGPPSATLAADGAADGVDEWAAFFLAVRWGQRFGALPEDLAGRTVHLHGTDDPAPAENSEWLITFGAEGCVVEQTHAKGDVALRGPASDLFLTMWRRRPLATLDVIGDSVVAERMLDLARF
jgi:hypothetical protein